MVVRLPGCRRGGERSAVKGIQSCDDMVGPIAVLHAIFASQFDGAFIGFCSTITEENLVETALFNQQLGGLKLWDIIELVGRLQQRMGLFRNNVSQHRMDMTEVVHRPPRGEIQICVFVLVPHPGPCTPNQDNWLPPGALHVIVLL